MQYEIQHKTDDYDFDILFSIWKAILPELDEKRIKWSYKENTDGKADLYLLKDLDKGQYFGLCGVIKKKFYIRGEEVNGGITADFALKKEYRVLGPALKLQREITGSKDYEVLIAFPNKKSEMVQLRAGFQVLGNITKYVKVLNSKPFLEKRYNFVVSSLAALFVNVYIKLCLIRHNKSKLKKYSVNSGLDESFEQIWNEAKSQFDFIGNRDIRHLTWRYTHDPYKSYETFRIEDRLTKEAIAYIIYYIENNIAYICDFLCKNPECQSDLFDKFILKCYNLKFDAISIKMIGSQKYLEFFKCMGFFIEQTDSKVLYFHNEKDFFKNRDVFLTIGDCDIS